MNPDPEFLLFPRADFLYDPGHDIDSAERCHDIISINIRRHTAGKICRNLYRQVCAFLPCLPFILFNNGFIDGDTGYFGIHKTPVPAADYGNDSPQNQAAVTNPLSVYLCTLA